MRPCARGEARTGRSSAADLRVRPLLVTYDLHRTWCVGYYRAGNRAEDHVPADAVAAGSHDDQVCTPFPRFVENHVSRITLEDLCRDLNPPCIAFNSIACSIHQHRRAAPPFFDLLYVNRCHHERRIDSQSEQGMNHRQYFDGGSVGP